MAIQFGWRDQKEITYKLNEEGFIGTLPLHLDENDVVKRLDYHIVAPNHVFAQNGVFLEV